MHTKRHFSIAIGPLAVALLFCLMLPARLLAGLNPLYRLAQRLHLPHVALRLVDLGETALLVALVFGLVYWAALALWRRHEWRRQEWRRLEAAAPHTAAPRAAALRTAASPGGLLGRALAYAAACLSVWFVYLYAYFPGVMTSDSFDQWDQAHNLALLNDWHPVGHTLLIWLLTRLWNSPAILTLAQMLGMALVWGWAMAYFDRAGVSRKLLIPLTLFFALAPFNGIMLVSLWKDIPYSVATLLLVFLLGRAATERAWLSTPWRAVGLGLALAAVTLLRHNGLLVALAVTALLLVFELRSWRWVALAGGTALALVLLVQNGIGFGLLKAKPNDPAVSYVVPVQQVAAVLHAGGRYTPKEQAVLERIAPLQAWSKGYLPYNADSLSKPWGYLKDPRVLEKIDQNRGDLLRVYLALASRNPRAVLASELDLTTIVWRITAPPDPAYRDYRYLFDLNSVERAGHSVGPGFAQVNGQTGVKAFLDRLLTASTANPLADTLFWEGGLYLFVTLAFGIYGLRRHGARFLILLAPALANALSLALAMPGENFRFVYPIVAPAALVALFAISGPPRGAD